MDAKPPGFPDRLPEPGENNIWFNDDDGHTVFVLLHGIFSDSRSCWLNRDRTCYWPQLILSDPRLGRPSIFLAGFYTDFGSGIYDIADCAGEVFSALNRTDEKFRRPVLSRRNILFICHSTGGIVARYILERHAQAFQSHHVGLVLIASPSYGSEWANKLGGMIEFYNNQLGLHLKWGNDLLKDLDDRFKELVDGKRILQLDGIEGCENHFVIHSRWLPNVRTVVVDRESAGRYFGRTHILRNTDHFSSVKPTNFDHPAHQLLVDFYTTKFGAAFQPRLAARLEASRNDMRSRNLPYHTPALLYALMYPGSLAESCLEGIRAGRSNTIRTQLRVWLDETLPNQKSDGFSDFEWVDRADVRNARDLAVRERSPLIGERHLILAILGSGSTTVRQLRQAIGQDFDALLRCLQNAEADLRKTRGPVFERLDTEEAEGS